MKNERGGSLSWQDLYILNLGWQPLVTFCLGPSSPAFCLYRGKHTSCIHCYNVQYLFMLDLFSLCSPLLALWAIAMCQALYVVLCCEKKCHDQQDVKSHLQEVKVHCLVSERVARMIT